MTLRALVLVFGAGLLGVACTGKNPRSCKDGSCTDPAYPFCDVSGAIGGDPEVCIAPTCTPGDFAECRGDTAVTCNGTGNDYDLVQCPRGCDAASGGCTKISCTPGTFSECQGDSQVVCNSTGDDYGLIACENGCAPPTGCLGISCTPNAFSRCQGDDAVTCNATGDNFTLVSCQHGCDPASGCLTCEPNATTCTNGTLSTCDATGHSSTSKVCDLGCAPSEARCRAIVPSNNLKQYLDAVVNPPDLTLTNATFHTDDGAVTVGGQMVTVPSALVPASGATPAIRVFVVRSLTLTGAAITATGVNGTSGPAAAFVAHDDITINGTLVVDPLVGSGGAGCGAGIGDASLGSAYDAAGGGGGGNATAGGSGGDVPSSLVGGLGGSITGTPAIIPLRGGCAGGSALPSPNGGGVLQISTSGRVTVAGTISVIGGVGTVFREVPSARAGGGGAGGNVLLEAARVDVTSAGRIDGRGGNGFQDCATPTLNCGSGGPGATATSAAADGGSAEGGGSPRRGGGGGGGLGRLRINTLAGTFTPAAGSIIHTAVTSGTIATF